MLETVHCTMKDCKQPRIAPFHEIIVIIIRFAGGGSTDDCDVGGAVSGCSVVLLVFFFFFFLCVCVCVCGLGMGRLLWPLEFSIVDGEIKGTFE